ncbi:MAG TPA: hypothetical protein ACFYEM_10275, partial [Candidatus Hypogeohydataceae bacterium YC40]
GVDISAAGANPTYGGYNNDWASSIQQTSDGGFIVAGYYSSYYLSFPYEIGWGHWVLKLRPDGTVEWQKAYEGVGAESIQQTKDGGYIVAGATRSFSPEGFEIHHLLVLKLRSDGAVEWQRAYGGNNFDRSSSIQQTIGGGYIVAGWTNSFGRGDDDFWVLKLRPDGTVEWQKTYGGGSFDGADSICETSDKGYIVAGHTGFGIRGDLWVLKLRPDGAVEWQKAYGGINHDEAESIQQTSDGGYIVAGKTASFGRTPKTLDFWVLKLNPDGSINPSCNYFVIDTDASGIDSNATILDTNADVRDTNADVRDSNAIPQVSPIKVMVTDVPVNILCP